MLLHKAFLEAIRALEGFASEWIIQVLDSEFIRARDLLRKHKLHFNRQFRPVLFEKVDANVSQLNWAFLFH